MYKLNNKGWGLNVFITFICVFIIAIIAISIGAAKMGIGSKKKIDDMPVVTPAPTPSPVITTPPSKIEHSELETTVETSAKNYATYECSDMYEGETRTVTIKMLITKDYLDAVIDDDGKTCTGYVKIIKTSNEFSFATYIKCEGAYETSGYTAELDENL